MEPARPRPAGPPAGGREVNDTRRNRRRVRDLLYTPLTAGSDHAIIDAVGAIAAGRGVTRAQVALAWLHSKPVVTAPLVGANTVSQIDDAVASLDIELTAGELADLERPYTPRYDFQGISGKAELQKIRDRIPGYASA